MTRKWKEPVSQRCYKTKYNNIQLIPEGEVNSGAEVVRSGAEIDNYLINYIGTSHNQQDVLNDCGELLA